MADAKKRHPNCFQHSYDLVNLLCSVSFCFWCRLNIDNILNISLQFLVELSLIEIEGFLDFRPSIIAASAIVIARSVMEIKDPWVCGQLYVSLRSLLKKKE